MNKLIGISGVLLHLAEKLTDKIFSMIPRTNPDAKVLSNTRLIAHRGMHNNPQGIIENTLPAFNLAQQAGCWGIEFDIRATSDGVLVVNHDASLNRLWGPDRLICDVSFENLRALEPSIPTLTEVVASYGKRMHLYIELKAPFSEFEALAKDLQDLTPGQDYHLLTLDESIFNNVDLFSRQCMLLVATFNVKQYCDLSIKKDYAGVLGNYLLMNNKYVRQLQQAQKIVGVGFVDSQNSLYRELGRGVDYIFTNRVDKLAQIIA